MLQRALNAGFRTQLPTPNVAVAVSRDISTHCVKIQQEKGNFVGGWCIVPPTTGALCTLCMTIKMARPVGYELKPSKQN